MWKPQVVTNSLESNYRHICPATLPRRQSAKEPNFDQAVGEKQLFLNGSFLLILPPCPCLAPLSSHVRTLSLSPEKEKLRGCLRPGASLCFLGRAPGNLRSSPRPRPFYQPRGFRARSPPALLCLFLLLFFPGGIRTKGSVCCLRRYLLTSHIEENETIKHVPFFNYYSFFLIF